MDNKNVKISVRDLVEFTMRSGDIDSTFISSTRAVEGTRAHRMIQKSYGDEYMPEVQLSHVFEYMGFSIEVEGRADGIIVFENDYTIDEIKTTLRDMESVKQEDNPQYWAQAECYGYIFCMKQGIDEITIQLTYFQIESGDIKRFTRLCSIDELKDKFYRLIGIYYEWLNMEYKWAEIRNESIKVLGFPFESYRKGQREMAVAVYRTITEGKKIFIKAPTGIGKTISTLFPSIKALQEGHISKIFYLTAKTAARHAAVDALIKMKGCGLNLKTIVITAKEKVCPNERVSCNPGDCSCALGHFDRVGDAVRDILNNEDIITKDVIESYAAKHCVCPFEFSLDVSLWVDCIICDYNYVFDPRVYLKRFFLEGRGDYAFLIDEAHNLADRAREMFSAGISKRSILNTKKLMKGKNRDVEKSLNKLNSEMVKMRKMCGQGGFVQEEPPEDFYKHLQKFVDDGEKYLRFGERDEAYEGLLVLYFDCLAFSRIYEMYDSRYVTYIEKSDDAVLKLFCIDPSYLLGEAIKRGKASVFFSATLLPLKYFKEILGGDEGDYTMQLNSPFEKENMCLLVAGNISTRYKNREDSYEVIAEYIKAAADKRTGNYLVFFPSYEYMNEVYNKFIDSYPEFKTIIQFSVMKEEERDEFLNSFKPDNDATLIGFGVLGGIFSEGIDLKGERLIGIIIIGVGLPQICFERDIIRNYFNSKNGLGYEYAYMYPGMIKVMQAAGRVIRTESDRGIVLLIDDRFLNFNYRKLFPREWDGYKRVSSTGDVSLYVREFWEKSEMKR